MTDVRRRRIGITVLATKVERAVRDDPRGSRIVARFVIIVAIVLFVTMYDITFLIYCTASCTGFVLLFPEKA